MKDEFYTPFPFHNKISSTYQVNNRQYTSTLQSHCVNVYKRKCVPFHSLSTTPKPNKSNTCSPGFQGCLLCHWEGMSPMYSDQLVNKKSAKYFVHVWWKLKCFIYCIIIQNTLILEGQFGSHVSTLWLVMIIILIWQLQMYCIIKYLTVYD